MKKQPTMLDRINRKNALKILVCINAAGLLALWLGLFGAVAVTMVISAIAFAAEHARTKKQ